MSDALSTVNKELKKKNKSAAVAQDKHVGLQKYFDKIQELKKEMYKAREKAADEVSGPYLEKIAQLEEQYAFLAKVAS